MKTKHFRIVELPEYQVLLTKDFDNEEALPMPLLTFSFFVEGAKADFSLRYSLEEKRDELFETLSNEEVENIAERIIVQYIEDSEED